MGCVNTFSIDVSADRFAYFAILRLGLSSPNWVRTAEGIELEREVVTHLIDVMAIGAGKLTGPKCNALVIQAEEWMRSHLHDAVGVAEMCLALNANERTVRMAFQQRYGMGPMDFLRVLRLSEVRHKLLVSSLSTDKIQSVGATGVFHIWAILPPNISGNLVNCPRSRCRGKSELSRLTWDQRFRMVLTAVLFRRQSPPRAGASTRGIPRRSCRFRILITKRRLTVVRGSNNNRQLSPDSLVADCISVSHFTGLR